MGNIRQIAREAIVNLEPYRSARGDSATLDIMLDANENPFGGADGMHRYPSPQPEPLVQALCTRYGVGRNQLLLTRGSDEGIDLLIRTFCEATRDAIAITPPTYGMYEVCAQIQGAAVIRVPLLKDTGFSLDIPGLSEIRTPHATLIFLCSPNNPTGNLLDTDAILQLCQHWQDRALVVVDEAYIEFSDARSMSRYLDTHANLVVLRTLSKAAGLAGVRLGCVLGSAEVIALLRKVIAPYPIPTPVVPVVLAGLAMDRQAEAATIRSECERLAAFLKTHPRVIQVYPTDANFILVRVLDAERWMAWCQTHRIVLRSRHTMLNLAHCIRISVGTPDENTRLMEVLTHV